MMHVSVATLTWHARGTEICHEGHWATCGRYTDVMPADEEETLCRHISPSARHMHA